MQEGALSRFYLFTHSCRMIDLRLYPGPVTYGLPPPGLWDPGNRHLFPGSPPLEDSTLALFLPELKNAEVHRTKELCDAGLQPSYNLHLNPELPRSQKSVARACGGPLPSSEWLFARNEDQATSWRLRCPWHTYKVPGAAGQGRDWMASCLLWNALNTWGGFDKLFSLGLSYLISL